MPTPHRFPALLALVSSLALACTPKPSASDKPTTDGGDAVVVEDEPADSTAKVVELTPLKAQVTVETGAELRYSMKSHASVGYGGDFSIGDPTLLKHVRTDMAYDNPVTDERGRPPGGDAGTETFVFEALKAGTATLKITEQFRGEIQTETEFTLTIVDP